MTYRGEESDFTRTYVCSEGGRAGLIYWETLLGPQRTGNPDSVTVLIGSNGVA